MTIKNLKLNQGFGIKIAGILIITMLSLLPLKMIRQITDERESSNQQVENELVHQFGGEQTIGCITIGVPTLFLVKYEKDSETKYREEWGTIWTTPEKASISGNLAVEERNRGIYKIPTYKGNFSIIGTFAIPENFTMPGSSIIKTDLSKAFLSLEIPTSMALLSTPEIDLNSKKFKLEKTNIGPGILDTKFATRGSLNLSKENSFSVTLNVTGARKINFLPLAGETEVNLISNWQSPSYQGSTLPVKHNFGKDGFSANWTFPGVKRDFTETWTNYDRSNVLSISSSDFGVRIMQPVNLYKKTERSLKYGILFILIPFLSLLIFELLLGLKIHPIQYLFVAASNTVFYLLLLSLSEHIPFWLSYILAGASVTSLLIFYLTAVLKSVKRALIMIPEQISLYGLLYLSLASEDYSLLVGTLGIFAILAIIMTITRKINWYTIGKKETTLEEVISSPEKRTFPQ
ncbi:MAG: cell envelope integrity protein CreD [Spirochaetales bacterium]|nr:cell envelope integrity protein CreD [Spirochaetales bacterium]